MATVTTPSGEVLENVQGGELEYYRGEGYPIVEDDAVKPFPVSYVDGEYVPPVEVPVVEQVEQLPEGQFAELDSTERTHPGTGEPNEGVEATLDGPPVEISNSPAGKRR